ncbi:hypothetical protein GGF46_000114 [Coemansia sp. RSA 552]|nr:hypothetical protein GGF46_000114 [Coemansia sp. RSA 552]
MSQNDSSAMKTDQAPPAPAAQNLPANGVLEEDDEFEDFPAEDWAASDEDQEDVTLWNDNWDDDDLEDDFSKQLRVELEKASQPQPMAVSN